MKKLLAIAVILAGLTAVFALMSHQAGAQERPKGLPKGAEPVYPEEDKNACDMKTLEKAYYCKSCHTILKGYSCIECKSNKCANCAKPKDAEPEDKPVFKRPAYLFAETEIMGGNPCPCCEKDKLISVDLVDKKEDNKCRNCNIKTAQKKRCARSTEFPHVKGNIATKETEK